MICGSGGSKSRLAKAACAEPAGQMWDEKSARRCGAKHISKSKCTKHTRSRTTFGSWDFEKVHAVVARSTFPSQNVQNNTSSGPLLEVEISKKCTPLWREAHFQVKMYKTHHASDHFWKLRFRKSARRCGAKHISKSKCTKHTMFGPLLEVEMSKKCTPLWREAHFEVKMYKTHHVRTTFGGSDVEKVHAVVARSTFRSQNDKNTRGSDHFWRFRCRFASLHFTLHSATLHYTTSHYITLHYLPPHFTTLHSTTLQLQLQLHNYTPLHSTTLHYTLTPHYFTLHYTTFHYTSLHYTTLHYTTTTNYTTTQLHNYIPLHSTTLNYTTLHYTTLHYTTLHYNYNYTLHNYTPLHYTTLHYTTLHFTALHDYELHSQLHTTTLHYITLHSITLEYIAPHWTRQVAQMHYREMRLQTDRLVDR